MDTAAVNATSFPVQASMAFLARDPLYAKEKPYKVHYASSSVPPTNHIRETVNDIPIRDLRGLEHELTFLRNGIAVIEIESKMRYEDFNVKQKIIDCYCDEISRTLLGYMQAKAVQVFDFNIRRRDARYPEVTDSSMLARDQPTRNVHIGILPLPIFIMKATYPQATDATRASVLGMIKGLNSNNSDAFAHLAGNRVVYVK
ncbi:uncharacterized protein PG998_012861 [Apiospora kogelbergensis]|uniref:uncharacterized protein n=1 Tax=Apiospora kogelbergensis TaxID=1337665 RepID=UPI0031323D32